MFWTDQRIELLKKLGHDGLSPNQSAGELEGVTRIDMSGESDPINRSEEMRGANTTVLVPTLSREHKSRSDPLPNAIRRWRNVRAGDPLAIYLTIFTLDRLVRELLPFYGVDCPVAVVVESNGSGGQIVRGTLATIEGWTAGRIERSMLVLVG